MTREEKSKLKQKELVKEEKKVKDKKYLFILLKILILIIIIVFLGVLYSRFIATSGLLIKEYKIDNQLLPSSFHGFKIVQFSDLHYGSTIDKRALKNIVKKTNILKPDLIVFTGDLIDKDYLYTDTDINDLKSLLTEFKATTGKYAISGNHDYSNELYPDILNSSGFKFLDNNYELIYYKGYEPILLTGLSSSIKEKDNIDKAYEYFKLENSNKNIYTISLLHEPDNLDKILTNYKVDLALAGHSHNGQIRLPVIGSLKTIRGAKKYYEERYQVQNTELLISGGLGTSTYKYRLFNRPSINFV
ncbi:MAG: metallophosphoesterase, partial [Bacilli bacterium]